MRKKICIVGPSLQLGGIERASVTIANYLKVAGHEILFLTIFKQRQFFQLEKDIRIDEPEDGSNMTRLHPIRTILRIRRVVSRFKPDSILAYNKFYASLVVLALFGTSYPVYVSDRASPYYRWRQSIKWFMKAVYLVFPPKGAIAQTTLAAAFQKKYFSKKTKVKVIPNAIRSVIQYPGIYREKIILAVGRLHDRLKGFDQLIEAFALVDRPEWKLTFAGSTKGAEYLEELVLKHKLEDRVVFLGEVKNIDLHYAKAGIFVIPSRSEGFPNALCEAMSAGAPCISFDFVAGPRDIITSGVDGIIVKEGNVIEMASAIENLIDNPELRKQVGENAANTSKRFECEIIGQKIADFILARN